MEHGAWRTEKGIGKTEIGRKGEGEKKGKGKIGASS